MKQIAVIFLQFVLVLFGTVILAALLWEPQVEGRNVHATNFDIYFKDPFLILIFLGSVPCFVAIYRAFKLLTAIKKNELFTLTALKQLQTIKYCAFAIIGFVVVAEICILFHHGEDDPAGGVFVGALISFASLIVAAAAITFEQVLQNGITKRSENHIK